MSDQASLAVYGKRMRHGETVTSGASSCHPKVANAAT